MSTTPERIAAFVRDRLVEDELWALAASATPDADGTVTSGLHWTWALGDNWEPVDIDPTATYVGEAIEFDGPISLVTTEEFPLSYGGTLRHQIAHVSDEVRTGDAGHIVRHDPASVLRRAEATRAVVAACLHTLEFEDYGLHLADLVLRRLAACWSDSYDYRQEWALESTP